jgi:predicted transcriptional regulator
VDLRVDDETYQAIRGIADQGNRKVSDVVRDAIRRYLEAS